MNGGGAASISMPFWYLNRFTDYMPDLAGKMKVAPMPLWADGGHKSAQMGGTGTAVALEISTGDGRSTVDAPTDPSATRTVTIRSSSGDVSYLGAE